MSKHTVAQVEDMIATEDDAVVSEMLRAYVTLLTEKADNGITHWDGTTHYAGCIQAGPKHYECALQEIGRLRNTITDLRVKLEKKEWVGLTDDEIKAIIGHNHPEGVGPYARELFKQIEAKLREKNGG